MSDDLNGLDTRINDRGFFERILQERERTEDEREKRMDERFAQRDIALITALTTAKEATASVRDEAREWQKTHNDLLRRLDKLVETLATKKELGELGAKLTDQMESRVLAVEKKTDDQDTRLDISRGRSGGIGSALSVIYIVVGIVLTVLLYYLAHHH